jgi:hypothetical protein
MILPTNLLILTALFSLLDTNRLFFSADHYQICALYSLKMLLDLRPEITRSNSSRGVDHYVLFSDLKNYVMV